MGTMGKLLFIIITALLCSELTLATFSYANVDEWEILNKNCGQNRQSPIDITGNLKSFNPKFPINFNKYGDMDVTLKNNGHSYQADIHYPPPPRREMPATFHAPVIAGGDLPGSYILAQIHFHWGSSAARGAEHTLNGCKPSGEMHFVHYKKDYGSVTEALAKTDGLAVLAVWLTPGPRPNQLNEDNTDSADSYFSGNLSSRYTVEDHKAATWEWFKEITPKEGLLPSDSSHSEKSSEDDDEHDADTEVYLRQLLPFNTAAFYRYNGSLTTPPCTENVMWTIFAEPLTVPVSFLDALRSLQHDKSKEEIVDNYRPTQRIGNRAILYSGDVSSFPSPCSKQCGYSLPQFEVKQEGQNTCWVDHTKLGVDVSNRTAGLKQVPSIEWVLAGNCTTTGLINTGYSLKVVYSETAPTWFISGGELKSDYQLAQIEVLGGSRHSLESVEYPMEMQMVLFMTKYGTLANALKQSDGVLVISRFFEKPVSNFEIVANDVHLAAIIHDNTPDSPKKDYWSSASPNVPALIGDMSIYYQYHGNDGMCNHDITWMVMHSAVKISKPLLKTFEGLLQTTQNNIRNKEVLKLDATKLTLRVNTPELYESYKGFMGITEVPTTVSGAGARFIAKDIMCLFVAALLVIKGGNVLA